MGHTPHLPVSPPLSDTFPQKSSLRLPVRDISPFLANVVVELIPVNHQTMYALGCDGPGRGRNLEEEENKVCMATASQGQLAKGGHQVRFLKQQGQWRARVNEHLPIGFTRTLDLPVYCEAGVYIGAIDQYDTTWHKHRIHVRFPERAPDQQGYVYVGCMGRGCYRGGCRRYYVNHDFWLYFDPTRKSA